MTAASCAERARLQDTWTPRRPGEIHKQIGALRKAWVTGSETSRSLGQIEAYNIYVSDLPESGDFNVLLVVKFKNDEMLAPNNARHEAFMAKFGADQQKATTEIAQRDYPAMRTITGEYRLREVMLK